ncbi:DUF2169 domain-containing protein [Corallococcus sp. CA047B]|uniref:DUF2169 family type VI secretion system accessory protein n=1 Tax=Corallococcus sp. CA047B TaxID=2316729 RepID=UPI0013154AA7|nr:DUF2169 domain-containing protein [Corallococcus sp. CA047B]
MSFQTPLSNHTPFAAEKFVLIGPQGQEAVLVVLAATFKTSNAVLQLADEQAGVRLTDAYSGPPGQSSLLSTHELALFKPLVDVIISGSAYAPGGRPAERVPIEVRVGDVQKALWAFGHRVWAAGLLTRPHPFTKMPLLWERAFGGVSPRTGAAFDRNPIGLGFDGARSIEGLPGELPNLEYQTAPIRRHSDAPPPAGLSPIAPSWEPRRSLAGTYDQRWLETKWPLLPTDFDPKHNQTAPVDQQSRTIVGGEPVRLLNLTPDGLWTFRLPVLDVPVHLLYDRGVKRVALKLDTVELEPDTRRVRLTARVSHETVRGSERLREIVLGHMGEAWLRARQSGRMYIDHRNTRGVDPSRPTYRV